MPNSAQTVSEVPRALHLSPGHSCDAVDDKTVYLHNGFWGTEAVYVPRPEG